MNTANLPLTEMLTPADAAAVGDAVRAAGEKGLAVYPIGGGTSLVDGVCSRHTPCAVADGTRGEKGDSPHLCEAPSGPFRQMGTVPFFTRPGIGISTAKLNRLIDYPADDMTVTIEAGMTVGELNKLLAEKRQWLPVDVSWPDRATIGGAIATNAAGPRRYAYGTMRDYLLGFTAVDGIGTMFSGGGRVVKNAAGYNMCRLMAGSLGTLGILTQATLMVRPLPEAAALLACEVHDFDLAEKLLAGLIHSQVRPVAVELSAGLPREGNPLFGSVHEGNVGRLCVGFEGSAAEVEWMLGLLREEWTSLGMVSPVLMPNLATDKFWRWIAEFPADETINVLPSKLIETVVERLKAAPDSTIQAHAGNGVIHMGREIGNSPLAVSQTSQEISPQIRVLRAIKERFDPLNILNPEFAYA